MAKVEPPKSASVPQILPRIAPPPGSDCPAVIRCCEEWTRVYDLTLAAGIAKHIAIVRGNQAYKNAMPALISRDNIRDFIACVTYGLLIRAILDNVATKLLYAAQVASTACKNASPGKSQTSHSKRRSRAALAKKAATPPPLPVLGRVWAT